MTSADARFPLPAAMVLLATLVGAPPSTAAPHPIVDRLYHCTVISRGQDIAPLAFSATPAINAFGQVAFATNDLLGGPESEVRVGWGDTSFGVPQTRRVARGSISGGAPFLSVRGVSIDHSGRIVYVGEGFLPTFFGLGLFRVPFYAIDTTLPTPLVETRESDPTSPLTGNLGAPLAGTRDVFFSASYFENGVPPQRTGLFQDDQLVREGAVDAYAYDASDSGAFAFLQTVGTFPALEQQLYHRTLPIDSVPPTTGSISGLSVASNAFELVSYGRFEGTGFEVRLYASGLATSVYVDSDDDALVAESSPGSDIPTSVNPYAEVALVAGDGDFEPRRVFVADGDFIHRVLCENDGILPVQIGTRAINAEGQIAFLGMNGSDQAVIARADPLQGLPASCVGLSAGSPCDDDDPATAAVCSAGGQCVGDPDGLPTSCLALPEDSPCDDGDPETLAFCQDAQCVTVPLPVPEPGAPASLFGCVAAIAASRGRRRRR
ncbi:MAG: hypothetical protein IPK00_20625 [Deltaproteobacteria bacterium]|nr:hypothetical protein [Deltaproteobacteria bacterium]